MNRLLSSLLATACLSVVSISLNARAQEPPKAALVETVTGRVILDGNGNGKIDPGDGGLPNVIVSDGIQFVRTDADGGFTLKFADDPLLPYKPAQVLAVSWPSGTWPVGRRYFVRRDDLKAGEKVEFLLREQKQSLPFTFAHGTDPHDNVCGGELFAADLAGMGERVKFCLMTGDLGYAGRENADKMFTSIRDVTQRFPVPMLHTPGNHDICDIHGVRWAELHPLAGYGPYTKYLGPLRYSFNYAGIHFVGLDWARIKEDGKLETGVPDTVIEWVKKDLALLKPGTRIFVWMHHDFRHGDDKFWDVLLQHKVERVIAGHSHRNKEETRRGIKRLTTQNLCGPYRLITVGDKNHALVNRCFVGNADSHQHSYAGQCKMINEFRTVAARRGTRVEVASREVKGMHPVEGVKAKELEMIAEIEPGTAKRFGVRVGKGEEIAITSADEFQMGDVVSPSARGRSDKPYRVWIVVTGDRLLVQVNNRVQHEKEFPLKEAVNVELFAEGGGAMFKKVEVWELKTSR